MSDRIEKEPADGPALGGPAIVDRACPRRNAEEAATGEPGANRGEIREGSEALNSALNTEQFVLQSIASSTISEAGTRASIYLSTLSGGLVAVGFASATPSLLTPMVFSVLPTIFVVGWLTVVRLVDTSVENIVAKRRMDRIRMHLAGLDPLGPSLLTPEDPRTTGRLGIRYTTWSFLFTMASMIGAVNSVVAGTLCALLLTVTLGLGTAVASGIGAVAGLVVLTMTLRYQRRRVRALF